MTAQKRQPRVVAELGRPETAQETADRLATNSRNYRSRKTVNNLVLSLLATLGAVFVLVLLVPRSDGPVDRTVDFAAVASQVQVGIDEPLVVPVLPDGWRANAAQWRLGGTDKIPSWYIGLLTPRNEFIGLTQALGANPTWIGQQLKDAPASQTLTLGGVTWDVYRNPAAEKDRGNFDYALVTSAGTSSYLLVGTADEEEFAALATAIAPQISSNGTAVTQ
jgi:hypothetical protein